MRPIPLDPFLILPSPETQGLSPVAPRSVNDESTSFAKHLQTPPEPTAPPLPAAKPERRAHRDDAPSPNKPPADEPASSRDDAPTAAPPTASDSGEQQPEDVPVAADDAQSHDSSSDEQESHGDDLAVVAAAAPVAVAAKAVIAKDAPVTQAISVVEQKQTKTPVTPAKKADDAPLEAAAETGEGVRRSKKAKPSESREEVPVKSESDSLASEPAKASSENSEVKVEHHARPADATRPPAKRVVTDEPAMTLPETTEAQAEARVRDLKRDRPRGDKSSAKPIAEPQTTAVEQTKPTEPSASSPTIAAPVADLAAPAQAATAPVNKVAPAEGGVAPAGSSQSRLPHTAANAARSQPRASGGPPLTNVEQLRLVQRVARAFQAAQNRGGDLTLRLSPPQLGSLKLEIKVQEGVLTARIETENAAAKTALVDNLPALKERLAEQGIQVEKFDVDVADRQPQGQPGHPQGDERHSHRQPHRIESVRLDDKQESASATASSRGALADGRLNVTI